MKRVFSKVRAGGLRQSQWEKVEESARWHRNRDFGGNVAALCLRRENHRTGMAVRLPEQRPAVHTQMQRLRIGLFQAEISAYQREKNDLCDQFIIKRHAVG